MTIWTKWLRRLGARFFLSKGVGLGRMHYEAFQVHEQQPSSCMIDNAIQIY